jgi:WD40 repeat protein
VIFSNQLLEEVGDVSDLLGSFLEEQINQLDDPEAGLVVLKAFVSVKGTKRQITEDEVVEFSKTLGKSINKKHLKELIQRYVNLRILRDKDENDRYELRHDSLAAKIFEKITLVEKELLEVRQFIENAYQTYEIRQLLLTEKDLRYLKVYEDRLFLEGKLKEYVELSKKFIEAKRKQFNTILRISLVSFIILILGIGIYFYRTQVEARQIKKAAGSLLQSRFAPGLSYESAIEAYEMDTSSSIAHYAILNFFYDLLEKQINDDTTKNRYNEPLSAIFNFKPCNANILSAEFSADGRLIYGWLSDNSVKVWESSGKEIFSMEPGDKVILTVSLSDDGEYIAVIYRDSTGSLWNLSQERIFSFPVSINPILNDNVIDFSPDGKYLVVSGQNNDAVIYDLKGNIQQHLTGHTGQINYLSFSPDNRFIASASDDSTVLIWNYDRNTSGYDKFSVVKRLGKARSCNFSANSKFILTADDDSTITVLNLYGERIYYFTFWDSSIDLYRGKVCNAEFKGNESIIRITGYEQNPDKLNSLLISYEQILIDEDDFHLRSRTVSPFIGNFWIDYHNYKKVQTIDYCYINNTHAYVLKGANYTLLKSNDFLPLHAFDGTNPVYPPDGNYLLCIAGNVLQLYPVNVNEIRRLIEVEKIFGELEYDAKGWIPFKQ